jgi:hypothetical protein
MNPFTATLETIWQRPTCAWISESAIASVAERLAVEEFPTPAWRDPIFPIDDLVFLDFLGIGNAINFAFTDFDTRQSFSIEYRGTKWRGAFAMWACLQRSLENGINVLSGDVLRTMSFDTVREIFAGQPSIPMLEDRWGILRQIGIVLCDRYKGRFHNFFQNAQPRAFGADGIVTRLLQEFPSFRDESLHRASGRVLKFEKRAQLMSMMYHGRAVSSAVLPMLTDFADVGPIADYGIPRALHSVGILKYAPDVEAQVASGKVIERDSVAEQEIRAQAIQAQLKLLTILNQLRESRISFIELDYKLWTLGRQAKELHHLTETTAY